MSLSDSSERDGTREDETEEDEEEASGGESPEVEVETSSDDECDETTLAATALVVGASAKHELLGTVKVLQLKGDEAWQEHKTLVELPPEIGVRKKVAQRWVFTDALAPVSTTVARNALSCLGSCSSACTPVGASSCSAEESLDERVARLRGEQVGEAPQKADIERRRKGRRLNDAKRLKRGRRKKMGERKTKEPKIDPATRLLQFPSNALRISNDKLFCDCCTTELSLRKISVTQHVLGKQHMAKLKEWERMKQRKSATIELLTEERKTNPDEKGGCLSPELQEFRFATVRTLMGIGVALRKVDHGLGALLRRAGLTVGTSADLRSYINLVRNAEIECLKSELKDQWMSVIFDGTTRLGEVIAVVVRYCTADFELQYRLIALTTTEKHMAGASLSGLLCRILVQRIGDEAFDRVIAASRDSCATNGVAVRSLKLSAMPQLMDVLCFSHTLHNCAKHMNLQSLNAWLSNWFTLMAHSHGARLLWRKRIDCAPVLFSKVRWWSRFECAMQIAKFFASLDAFLDDLLRDNIGEATTTALRDHLADRDNRERLQIDLAIVLDTAIFCEKTYRLEGDRLESLVIVEDIETILEKGRMMGDTMSTLPNVAAILRRSVELKVGTLVYDWFGPPYNKFYRGKVTKLPSADLASGMYQLTFEDGSKMNYDRQETINALDVRQLPGWLYAKESAQDAFDYLNKRLTDDPEVQEPYKLAMVYAMFKAIRVFDPGFVSRGNLTPALIDTLPEMIPWIKHETATLLQTERAEYVSAVKQSPLSFETSNVEAFTKNVLAFWRDVASHKHCKIPTWANEARRAFSVTPNSASTERVLSVLQRKFDTTQTHALSDYLEGAVMLEYNQRELG